MNIDWSKETKNMVYPEAVYKVRIDSYERCTAGTGTPQIRWKGTILEPQAFANKTVIEHNTLTEKSLWKLAWMVQACGVNVSKLPKMDVESAVFNRVLDACKYRTTYWYLKESITPSGNPKNDVTDYKKDSEQEELEVTIEEDVPEFLKE